MPRLRSLLLLCAIVSACEGCPEGGEVSKLSAAFTVEPAAIDELPLWAGYPRTLTLRVESHGAAPLLDLQARAEDVSGPAAVSVTLDGEALAPGARLPLRVTLSAPPGSTGPVSASIVVDAGADGAVIVPLSATVLLPPSCDDGNPCTTDRFDPEEGRCVHTVLDDGAACDDGSACTTGDACVSGRCLGEVVHCDDGVECTLDRCDPLTGCVYEPMPSRCDDEDPCTADVCEPFQGCKNPPLAEGALCHFDGCNEIGLCLLGQCALSAVPDGMPCEDGDACTRNDTCQAGECVSGERVGVGAAPPVVFEPSVSLELCRGPGMGAGCFGIVDERGVERVLAVEREHNRVRILWQGTYSDPYGAPCDPRDASFHPYEMGDGQGASESDDAPLLPASNVCASGVYLSALAVGAGAGSVMTTQITSARGPAAAAFVPSAGSGINGRRAPPREPQDPQEPPDPDHPPLSEPAVVVVHPDFLRTTVWVEVRDAHGDSLSTRRSAAPGIGPLAGLAVAVDERRIVVAAHPESFTRPFETCDAEGCEELPVPLWLFSEPRVVGAAAFERLVHLPRVLDGGCAGVTHQELPVELHDLTLAFDEDAPRVSLRMTRSICGDVAPGTLGLAPDAPRPWHMAAWSFRVDEALLASSGIPRVEPLFAYDGSEPLVSFRTTTEGGATSLRHVPVLCPPECDCPEEGTDCDCAFEATCFDTVLERTLDVTEPAPEELVRILGRALFGQTAPLVVEGELRAVSLLGGTLELVGRGPGGGLSRLVAPSPPGALLWDERAMLLPGPPESQVVVGRGLSALEDPVTTAPAGAALVQVFGCGFGEAAPTDRCLEASDCDEGLECDHSVCLPGPDCEASGTCDLCWGRCTEPDIPDAGSPDEDGGWVDEDAGTLDDSGTLADAG